VGCDVISSAEKKTLLSLNFVAHCFQGEGSSASESGEIFVKLGGL